MLTIAYSSFLSSVLCALFAAKFGKSIEDTGVTSTVTFDDIRGADEVKAELVDIVEYLKDPQKFTEMGAKLPKGNIFYYSSFMIILIEMEF